MSALDVWVTACRLRFEDVAQRAAQPLTKTMVDSAAPSALEGVSAGDLFRLRKVAHAPRLLGTSQVTYRPFDSSAPALAKSNGSVVSQVPPYAPGDVPPPDIICRSLDGVDLPSSQSSAGDSLVRTAREADAGWSDLDP